MELALKESVKKPDGTASGRSSLRAPAAGNPVRRPAAARSFLQLRPEDGENGRSEERPRPNRTGLPDTLKTSLENRTGLSLDEVRVHYNSSRPARYGALAFAKGTEIHVAPGQEKSLPHEAWHVVQQMQGRVTPNTRINGEAANTDSRLEREADEMGAKALSTGKSMLLLGKRQSVKIGNSVIQCGKRKEAPDVKEPVRKKDKKDKSGYKDEIIKSLKEFLETDAPKKEALPETDAAKKEALPDAEEEIVKNLPELREYWRLVSDNFKEICKQSLLSTIEVAAGMDIADSKGTKPYILSKLLSAYDLSIKEKHPATIDGTPVYTAGKYIPNLGKYPEIEKKLKELTGNKNQHKPMKLMIMPDPRKKILRYLGVKGYQKTSKEVPPIFENIQDAKGKLPCEDEKIKEMMKNVKEDERKKAKQELNAQQLLKYFGQLKVLQSLEIDRAPELSVFITVAGYLASLSDKFDYFELMCMTHLGATKNMGQSRSSMTSDKMKDKKSKMTSDKMMDEICGKLMKSDFKEIQESVSESLSSGADPKKDANRKLEVSKTVTKAVSDAIAEAKAKVNAIAEAKAKVNAIAEAKKAEAKAKKAKPKKAKAKEEAEAKAKAEEAPKPAGSEKEEKDMISPRLILFINHLQKIMPEEISKSIPEATNKSTAISDIISEQLEKKLYKIIEDLHVGENVPEETKLKAIGSLAPFLYWAENWKNDTAKQQQRKAALSDYGKKLLEFLRRKDKKEKDGISAITGLVRANSNVSTKRPHEDQGVDEPAKKKSTVESPAPSFPPSPSTSLSGKDAADMAPQQNLPEPSQFPLSPEPRAPIPEPFSDDEDSEMEDAQKSASADKSTASEEPDKPKYGEEDSVTDTEDL